MKDAPEHVLKIRTSRLGPVQIEDGECLARHSVCDYPSTNLEAGFQMNMATSVDDFVTGLKRQTCPALNIVFADMNGNIGYFPTGLVPKRKKGNGELPLLATGTADGWDGFYSEEEKPYLLNPKKGFVVTANNAVLPDTRLPIFSAETFPAFRADRIEQLIRSKPKLSIQDNMDIQTDSFSKGAEFLISKIRGFTFDSNDAVFVMSQLKQWDFRMDAGIAPYLFYRFERHLIGNIFVDEFQNEDDKRLISNNWIYRLMNYPQQNAETDHFLAFVDNVKTPERESFRDIVEESLRETYADYKEKSLQREPDWLTVHRLSYRHPLGRVPVLGSLLNRGPFGVKGGQECILSAGFNGRLGFDVSHMSTFRMVMDFSDFSKSQYIDSSGQSGHFMSPHYDDQIGLYVDLQYRDMEGISAKSSVLKIVPAN